MRSGPSATPDGRYIVVRGRLWRCANPALDRQTRDRLTHELMDARRAKGAAMRAGDDAAQKAARARVDAAKVALGERGPPWWTDGAPDLNRRMAKNTPYAAWWSGLAGSNDADRAVDAPSIVGRAGRSDGA